MNEIKGNHFIADEVIATIALNAALEVENITIPTRIADGFVEKFGKKTPTKGIKVEQQEDGVKIELKLVTDYGINIPQICHQVQGKIIHQVEKLTGLNVLSVDINVTGINLQNTQPVEA
jgi:uncharacterized alkaline shock family protein YloU